MVPLVVSEVTLVELDIVVLSRSVPSSDACQQKQSISCSFIEGDPPSAPIWVPCSRSGVEPQGLVRPDLLFSALVLSQIWAEQVPEPLP